MNTTVNAKSKAVPQDLLDEIYQRLITLANPMVPFRPHDRVRGLEECLTHQQATAQKALQLMSDNRLPSPPQPSGHELPTIE